jgi:transcription elongation factor/antiterminator RfaH
MNSVKSDEGGCWYAVHTHLKQEVRAETNLRTLDLEVFAPRVRERRHNYYSGAASYVIKPLFPRYIFVRLKMIELIQKINFTRGVYGIVSFGNSPTQVDGEIINLIRSRIGEDGFVQMAEELKPGDKVLIKEGSLKNFVGVFERAKKDSDRVFILLNTVSFQPVLEIRRDRLQKLSCEAG